MPDASLLLLLDEVRQKTLRILKSVPPESARWAPPGLQNTILWHAGHAFVLLEWLTMTALDREPQTPGGWFEMFSWESRPAQVPANRWPSLSEVIKQLEAQHEDKRRLISESERPGARSSVCRRSRAHRPLRDPPRAAR